MDGRLRHLLEPELPAGLHNRLGDNWRPLVALADLAGGRWPELIRTAALSSLSADQEEAQLIALLRGIQRAFGEKDFLETQALINSLIAHDEHDWETANNHKPVGVAEVATTWGPGTEERRRVYAGGAAARSGASKRKPRQEDQILACS